MLLTDDDGNILQHRNFRLPEPVDSLALPVLSAANERFLKDKLATLATTTNVIHITIARGFNQHLYYEDSTLLKRLSYYPYVQLLVMLVFIAVVYFAVLSTKKAEQNKVWVGLSKETAHQLGTPISSLMAWMELLPDMGVDADTVAETNVNRQAEATAATVGEVKVQAMSRRLLEINPDISLELVDGRYTADTADGFDLDSFDFIIDAIDSLADKALLLLNAAAHASRG